jgi:hypothetical protein
VRKDQHGNHNIWVIHNRPYDHPKHYVVRHWQVNPNGKIRTATEPRAIVNTLVEARAVIPYGLLRVPIGVPELRIIEVWF